MRMLLWVGLGALLVIWLLRSSKKLSASGKDDDSNMKNHAAMADDAGNVIEPMVQCAHCGVHVPASESVAGNSGMAFCSEEHRIKHVRP